MSFVLPDGNGGSFRAPDPLIRPPVLAKCRQSCHGGLSISRDADQQYSRDSYTLMMLSTFQKAGLFYCKENKYLCIDGFAAGMYDFEKRMPSVENLPDRIVSLFDQRHGNDHPVSHETCTDRMSGAFGRVFGIAQSIAGIVVARFGRGACARQSQAGLVPDEANAHARRL
ncbi:MAG: hypothetical protein KDH19_20025 [Geminicoccaceae bacterium]|nr:hypothetical protein [Geminicoccaceae bacterium]